MGFHAERVSEGEQRMLDRLGGGPAGAAGLMHGRPVGRRADPARHPIGMMRAAWGAGAMGR